MGDYGKLLPNIGRFSTAFAAVCPVPCVPCAPCALTGSVKNSEPDTGNTCFE